MKKETEKVTFNCSKKILKAIDKLVDDSDNFNETRSSLLNRILKEYIENMEKGKRKRKNFILKIDFKERLWKKKKICLINTKKN